ncbi:Ger(x)C family spore germination protein [Peribacillus sp. NPDC097675]|uniref:Ger(x)C family spore germination protein n=1 Tax=Peribacillus sp. NPDC097675 TaxID=3390618 RepID=UPI003CFC0596
MNHKAVFLYMILITIFLSGCWNQKELNDLAIISAMAIDKNDDGTYTKTIQIINPGNVAGGLQGGGGGQSPAVSVYSATGQSVLDAHFNATSKVSRRLYHSHANLLVISEELAKEEGITTILDAFERDPEIRTTLKVVIAHDTKAGDLLKTLTAIDKIPAEKVNGTLRITEIAKGEQIEVKLQDLISTLTSDGQEPVLSGFRMKGKVKQGKDMKNVQKSELDTTLEADGLAVFREGKLIDWYQGETSRGVVWILDKIKETNVKLDWGGERNSLAYTVIRQKAKVSANTNKPLPVITIRIRAEGDIREVRKPINLDDPTIILDLEKELRKEIKMELEKAVKKTQQNKTDIFGFGEVIHRSNPKQWERLKSDWNENYFPKLTVQVEVEAFIRRSGLRKNSYLSDM